MLLNIPSASPTRDLSGCGIIAITLPETLLRAAAFPKEPFGFVGKSLEEKPSLSQ